MKYSIDRFGVEIRVGDRASVFLEGVGTFSGVVTSTEDNITTIKYDENYAVGVSEIVTKINKDASK